MCKNDIKGLFFFYLGTLKLFLILMPAYLALDVVPLYLWNILLRQFIFRFQKHIYFIRKTQ